jgi:hypothetical protein
MEEVTQNRTENHKEKKLLWGVILGVVLVAIIAGLFFMKANTQTDSADVTKPSVAGARDIDIVVNDGKIVSGSNEIKVKKGEQVYIHIKTQDEQSMKLHLDGYDIGTEMSKSDYGGFLFTADKVGSFNIELFSDDEGAEDAADAGKVVGSVIVED